MKLFVVKHQHGADGCPAADPKMGPMLLKHVSRDNAVTMGMKLHGEAVVDGAHTFYLILEATDEGKVKEFMYPFSEVGSVEIMPANTCEVVVSRAKC